MTKSEYATSMALCFMLVCPLYTTCGNAIGTYLYENYVIDGKLDPSRAYPLTYEKNETNSKRPVVNFTNKKLNDLTDINMTCVIFENKAFDLENIKNLKLILSNNKLVNISEDIKKLQLSELDLSHNNLKKIPKWLLGMKGLKYLDIRGNKNLKKPTFYPDTITIIYDKYNN